MDYDIFAGSYAEASEEGIQWLRFNTRDGRLTRLGGVSGIDSPSFVAVLHEKNRMYAVSELEEGGFVVSYRLNPKRAAIEELNRQPSFGGLPCHLTVDSSNRWLLIVNYWDGCSICVYPLDEEGRIGERSDFVQHTGSGANERRQERPHAHSIFQIPGSPLYLAADLGTDQVYAYRLDRQSGKLQRVGETAASRSGAGPRHLAFHPTMPFVYLIEELTSTISAYRLDRMTGELRFVQAVSALPEGFEGESTCAEVLVHESGQFVYGSNRGHDSIATFRVGNDGTLRVIGHSPSRGGKPRNFALVPGGEFMLAANQDTDNIVVMRIDANGVPQPSGQSYAMKSPVCLKAFPAEKNPI